MLQDIIETVNPRFYTVTNMVNYGSKQIVQYRVMVTTSSGTRISSKFSPQRHVLRVPSSKLEFWNWKTHPPGLQGNQKYDCSSHAPTRQPATSGLGLLLSYSLAHFVQLTCWSLVPISSTDVLYFLEVNVFVRLPLFLIFFEMSVGGGGLVCLKDLS